MTPEMQTTKKEKLTFIGFLFAAYYAALACYNEPIVLYPGFVLIAGLVVLDKLFSKERLKIEFPTACKCLYYFTIYCFFSRFWAWNEALVTSNSKFLIPAMVFMVININYFVKIRSTKACLFAIILSGLALGVYVVVDNGGLSAFYNLATQQGNRIVAGDRNANSIGMVCAFAVVTLFYYAIFKKKKSFYLISVFPFVVSIATGSRKSILLLLIGVLMLVLLSQKDKKGAVKYLKLLGLLALLFVCLKFVLSLEIMSTVNERMEQLFATLTGDAFNADSSSLTRAKMIKFGWQQFKETPFMGIGFGNSPELNWKYMRIYTYSHNDYIEHLINGGFISLILYYATIIYLAVKHIKLMKLNKKPELVISFTTIIMYLVMSAASVTYYGVMNTYLYFTLWISEVAICEREQREKLLEKGDK